MGENGKGIGWAVHAMQGGGKVRRPNMKGLIFLMSADTPGGSVIMYRDEDDLSVYVCTQTDLLARDWEAVV